MRVLDYSGKKVFGWKGNDYKWYQVKQVLLAIEKLEVKHATEE
jgi:hypothetical protein